MVWEGATIMKKVINPGRQRVERLTEPLEQHFHCSIVAPNVCSLLACSWGISWKVGHDAWHSGKRRRGWMGFAQMNTPNGRLMYLYL